MNDAVSPDSGRGNGLHLFHKTAVTAGHGPCSIRAYATTPAPLKAFGLVKIIQSLEKLICCCAGREGNAKQKILAHI